MDGNTAKQEFPSCKFRCLAGKTKDKSKIKTCQEKAISANFCNSNYIPLAYANINCESKMEKQDLQSDQS